MPDIPPWKESVSIRKHNNFDSYSRPCISSDLGCPYYGAVPPHPNPNGPEDLLAGALKRFATDPPPPDPIMFQRLLDFVERKLFPLFTPLAPDVDISVPTWLENCQNYTIKRKQDLQRKYDLVADEDDPFYRRAKSFAKDEFLVGIKHVRIINSASDEFKCFVGPVFRYLEKALFKNPHFIKYIPVPDRPQALFERIFRVGSRYGETDFTSMEAHFDRIRFEIEIMWYKYMTQYLPERDRLWRHFEKLRGKNVCVFKFFTMYIEASRLSGEMNTSLGNGFVNFALNLFLDDLLDMGGEFFFEGDDGVFCANKMPTKQDYANLGFDVKVEPKEEISDMSFCGLVFDPLEKINVTDPMFELTTFGWSKFRYVNARRATRLALIRAKSLSMLYQYSGCPILHELALYGLRVTNRISVDKVSKYMSDWEKTQFLDAMSCYKKTKFREKKERPIGESTRLLVERVHGITVEDQLSCEAYLRRLDKVQVLYMPWMWKYHTDPMNVMWQEYVLPAVTPTREILRDCPFEIPRTANFQVPWNPKIFR